MQSQRLASAAAEVDRSLWLSVAGASKRVPSVGSYVYYFPQGNLEQCSPPVNLADHHVVIMRAWFHCKVMSVRYIIDPISDHMQARMLLMPLPAFARQLMRGEARDDDNDIVSSAKILTKSDAINTGGFSVPRNCAEMILPQLDLEADEPPVQTLVMKDPHGNAWEFKHIFRGNPRRHMLTTGWSRFVNAKGLVPGDSVVIMKKRSTGELFIGTRRRAEKMNGGNPDGAQVVAEIRNALRGVPFEVVYYPWAGVHEFVVMAEKARKALEKPWLVGMLVKMLVDNEDASKTDSVRGVISGVSKPKDGLWFGSPWRMVQVNWDYPEEMDGAETVNPWQLRCLVSSPLINPDFPPSKRYKLLLHARRFEQRIRPTSPPTTGLAANPLPPIPRLPRVPAPGLVLQRRTRPGLVPAVQRIPEPVNAAVSTVFSMGSSGVCPPAVSQSSVQLADSCDSEEGEVVSSIHRFGKNIVSGDGEGEGDGDVGGGKCSGSSSCSGSGGGAADE